MKIVRLHLMGSSGRSLIRWVLCLGMLTGLSAQADVAMQDFLWEQAHAQAACAVKPEDYAKAAATYQRLASDGVVSAALFMNLGSTWVMAGEGARAVAAFARAERYVGITPETRQGMLAALSKQTGRQQVDLPWSRTAFFWHFAFPCQVRAWAALTGWSLFWFGMFLWLLIRKRRVQGPWKSLAETGMWVGGLVTVVFGASVSVTFLQELVK